MVGSSPVTFRVYIFHYQKMPVYFIYLFLSLSDTYNRTLGSVSVVLQSHIVTVSVSMNAYALSFSSISVCVCTYALSFVWQALLYSLSDAYNRTLGSVSVILQLQSHIESVSLYVYASFYVCILFLSCKQAPLSYFLSDIYKHFLSIGSIPGYVIWQWAEGSLGSRWLRGGSLLIQHR